MNGNSSKQVLLSVLGIAVLVVAVVGVSFAFFTYSKNGEANNTVQTGSIFVQFTEGRAITLSNQFPILDEQGANMTGDLLGEGDNATLTFHVIGQNTSSKTMTYTITAVEGDTVYNQIPNPAYETDKTLSPTINGTAKKRLHDSGIKLYLDDRGVTVGSKDNKYSATTGTAVGEDGSLEHGRTLFIGTIPGETNTQKDNTFVLHMWISAAEVSINENTTVGDDTDNVYTSNEFKNLYYSLKVNVTANATN